MARRKHGKIDALQPELREAVEQMLLSNSTYADVVDYLATEGVSVSHSAVWRHAKNLHANVEKLNMAQTNMRYMVEELDKYPELDITEAILRLVSHNMFSTIAAAPETAWKQMDFTDLIKESRAIVRAASYKKRIDLQNQTDTETGLDAIKQLVFEAMAAERPDLYEQVAQFLEEKREDLGAEAPEE